MIRVTLETCLKDPDEVNNVSWQCVRSVRASRWECVTQICTFTQKNGECCGGGKKKLLAASKARLHSAESDFPFY